MKTHPSLKKPFGTARMVDIVHVRYLSWEDAFDVEFEDGLSFLEPHATIRKANHISNKAEPVEVVLDEETRTGFEVRYDTGETAEVSWSFIRELPPKARVGTALIVTEAPAKRIREKRKVFSATEAPKFMSNLADSSKSGKLYSISTRARERIVAGVSKHQH